MQQFVAAPLHYLRESLTSPTNLAVFLPCFERRDGCRRGSSASMDLFGLWWMWLLALGLAAAERPAGPPLSGSIAGRLCWRGGRCCRRHDPLRRVLACSGRSGCGRSSCSLVIGGIAAFWFSRRQDQGITVTAETIQRRDLEAIVSASGKIEPQKTVNISAQSMGRVTRLAVNEGDRVKSRPVPAADRCGGGGSGGAARRGGGGRRPDGAGAVTRRLCRAPGPTSSSGGSRSSGSRS